MALVGRIGEANASCTKDRKRRNEERAAMVENFQALRPSFRHSRVRGVVGSEELARVIEFIMIGDPREIWRCEAVRVRNWAMVTVLALVGLRDGELRQLTLDDVDTNRGRMLVARRPDNPDDTRLREPNAKTADRLVPVLDIVAQRIEDYIYGPQGDAAGSDRLELLVP